MPVFEHTLSLDPEQKYWSDHERAQFRHSPHAPPGEPGWATNVRLGMYLGGQRFLMVAGARGARSLASKQVPNATTRPTILIGQVVLQVESHRWEQITGRKAIFFGPAHAKYTARIWPTDADGVQWPLATPFDDTKLTEFLAPVFPDDPEPQDGMDRQHTDAAE